MLRIVQILLTMILVSGCAPTNLRETGVMDGTQSIRVVCLMPEKPLYKSVYSNATGGGGLLGYVIGKAIFNSAQSDLEPFSKFLDERDIVGEIYRKISDDLINLSWANIGGIDIKDISQFKLHKYASSIKEDILIVITVNGLVSPKFELLETVAEVTMYAVNHRNPKKLYRNFLIHQSEFYGKYKTFMVDEWKEKISDINDRYLKALEHDDSPGMRTKARRWRRNMISELEKKTLTISAPENQDGEKWLQDGGRIFKEMVNEGINRTANLVLLELSDSRDRDLEKFTVVPNFIATGPSKSVSPMIVYELEGDEDWRVIRVLRGDQKNFLFSIRRNQPVISGMGAEFLDGVDGEFMIW